MMLDTKGASEALTKKFICHMTSAQKATCGDAASGFWGRREEEGKKKVGGRGESSASCGGGACFPAVGACCISRRVQKMRTCALTAV